MGRRADSSLERMWTERKEEKRAKKKDSGELFTGPCLLSYSQCEKLQLYTQGECEKGAGNA